jgi:hypothetical protein
VSTDPRDVKGIQLLHQVYEQAVTDMEYRRELLDDPKTVLQKAGLEVPEGIEIAVHLNRPGLINLVLPSRLEDEELKVETIDIVAIAFHWPGI